MSDLNKEIEQMAEKMEKAVQEPTDKLFTIIKSLGPEGLKAKLPTLSEDEKLVLKAALEEMSLKKSVEFDKEAAGAKFVQGNIMDTKIQEDKADDDADEKLVKPEAAKHDHQGNPSGEWKGQVIKSIEDSEEQLETLISKAMDKCMGDEKMVKEKLSKKGMDEKKVQGALDKYKEKKMKKSEEIEKGKMKEEAAKKIMAMEEKEHGTKDPKKLVNAEKEEHEKKKVKKSEEDFEKAKKILKEEDQLGDAPEMNEKTMGKKESAPDIEDNAKASKQAQKDVKNLKVKKSLTWEDETRLFKANVLGRNFGFNLEAFVDETLKKGDVKEDLKKAQPQEDLNDLIEKSMDRNWDQLDHVRKMQENVDAQNGKLVKSFEENELARILGLSEEEAKKILG